MLQQLADYAATHLTESEPGFRSREVRWSLELAADGRFLGALPLGDGKRGRELVRCPDMHNMNAGGRAHFLVESCLYVTLLTKGNEDPDEKTAKRHAYYLDLVRQAAAEVDLLKPLADLLADSERIAEIRAALTAHKAKPTDWITWRIGGQDPRDDEDAQRWWRDWRRTDLSRAAPSKERGSGRRPSPASAMRCLLTGKTVTPLPTHPKIAGLSGVGGLAMGDVLVGFDKSSFGSFGLDQSANAAMGEEAVQRYVDGLNHLIRHHGRKLANTIVAHWYKDSIAPAEDPLAFLMGMETEEQTEAAALGAVRRLLDAIHSGERPDLGDNRYYALTLSGAAGRVMVRDWMEGRFEDLAGRIAAWFADLAIVARGGHALAHDPKFMAVCGALVRDLKDLPAPTAATLWRVALQGLPIPRSLMAQALARFRTEVIDKDQPPINHARMGLIRAYFVRRTPGGDASMTAYLNPDHPAPAYHCGRLLAVFANLQRAALGDVGAGVVQRYYTAASQTPGLILGRLSANARNHLGKLNAGLAWWYEEQLAEVMSRLGDGAPRILDLEGQGLFALGYYQQLAALRASRKTPAEDTASATDADPSPDATIGRGSHQGD
ncbi:type I-C CRISPR-associated protein Cas8c/Csd1 [Imhoffiella purpurea]|uniref:CRISPR-associated protein, Csd1 family n=1 Tax=Imhoffiella purpurea TaxID=1249627 RepID=W9VGC7_9GAMM|nr:type I-C CRISPR-associated protein Cas8c/Csd1 [Imhoffiella purpurea]EXJ15092.1 CRISPR-associated protein, Csd1 family [Imhoffiella purpurea]